MTEAHFRELVAEAIDDIPPWFAERMENVVIVVEDEPSPELLREEGMDADESLFGLYQGTPLTERSATHGNQLPDQITLFKQSIEAACEGDEDEMVAEIGLTLIHEVGHFFGMSEDEIMDIEDRYWYGDSEPDEGA